MEYIIIYYIYRRNHGILPWSIYRVLRDRVRVRDVGPAPDRRVCRPRPDGVWGESTRCI